MPVVPPREVVQRLLALIPNGPTPAMADVFAEDAVFEAPFLPPGAPTPEQGREAFRAHLREGMVLQRFESIENVQLHETSDPEVVIVEYRVHGVALGTGKRFANDIVMFLRIRDGVIVLSRVYANPLDAAVAFGMIDDLLAGLAS